MKNKKIFLLFCLWACFIFSNSLTPAIESDHISNGITYQIYTFLNLNIDFDIFHVFIRKLAHFIEYAGLGFFAGFSFDKEKRKTAILLCILVACCDETIQLFVEGRSGQISDVLLDSFGSLVGVYFTYFSRKLFTN